MGAVMPKEIKGLSSRKPPVPSDSYADIDDRPRRLQPIVARVDEMIRKSIPDLQYAVKWKRRTTATPIWVGSSSSSRTTSP